MQSCSHEMEGNGLAHPEPIACSLSLLETDEDVATYPTKLEHQDHGESSSQNTVIRKGSGAFWLIPAHW